MSKTSSLHHIVFATKMRKPTIIPCHKRLLYSYIWNILKNRDCVLYRIGGIEDHIHIFVDLSPRIALADLVRELKSRSSGWMRRSGLFPDFEGWCSEYFSESKERDSIADVVEYIRAQEEHHHRVPVDDEFRSLYAMSGCVWDDRDLM